MKNKMKEYPIHDAILKKIIEMNIFPSPFIRLDAWIEIYIPDFKFDIIKDKTGKEIWDELQQECGRKWKEKKN